VTVSSLPNPVVVPACADPATWLLALVCLAVEVAIVERALAGHGVRGAAVQGRLVAINLVSWTAFLVGVDRWSEGGEPARVGALEAAVVLVEAAAMRWLIAVGGERRLAWPWLLGWSFVANLASCALTAGVVLAFAVGANWLR
jgi:hypothetical protein